MIRTLPAIDRASVEWVLATLGEVQSEIARVNEQPTATEGTEEIAVEPEAEALWVRAVAKIEPGFNAYTFATWFRPLRAIDIERNGHVGLLRLSAPNAQFVDWVTKNYAAQIRDALQAAGGSGDFLLIDERTVVRVKAPP